MSSYYFILISMQPVIQSHTLPFTLSHPRIVRRLRKLHSFKLTPKQKPENCSFKTFPFLPIRSPRLNPDIYHMCGFSGKLEARLGNIRRKFIAHASDRLEQDGGRFHALNPLRQECNPPKIHGVCPGTSSPQKDGQSELGEISPWTSRPFPIEAHWSVQSSGLKGMQATRKSKSTDGILYTY